MSRRLITVSWLIAALLATGCAASSDAPRPDMAAAARAFRTAPVEACANGQIIAEAEEFQPENSGWAAKNWGENYYAATFANTFLSRKAFLGAAPETNGARATITVNVPRAGKYLALVRYEAAYRFETQFRLRIEQAGVNKLTRLYGARENVKIWAFKGGSNSALRTEVGWYWGAVENVVWEGHDAAVELDAGPATLTLLADRQPAPAAQRNIDLVLLTPNLPDVAKRIETEGYLPLDGLLTQEGDLWMRVTNRAASAVTVTAPPGREHSPYWVHQRAWTPRTVTAGPGATSEFVEVGGVLDSLNDGQWALAAAPAQKDQPLDYTVEFAARDAMGKLATIARFDSRAATLDLAYEANTRYTRKIRSVTQVLGDLNDYLAKHPVDGKPPRRTIVYCYTFEKRPGDEAYNKKVDAFAASFPLTTTDHPGLSADGAPVGYIDVRGVETAKLAEHLATLGDKRAKIKTVSLGDEIGLSQPAANAHDAFRAWAKSRGLKAEEVTPGAGEDWGKVVYSPDAASRLSAPRAYYYSRLFAHDFGIASLKARTDILRQHLPNAQTGANYSPHSVAGPYLGEAFQWITLFRRGGMTMPWGEDYIWQLPVGSQQMNFLLLDVFRAAVRYTPQNPIHYYVMPHWPGNTPESWRRQFFGDLGHGMKIVNLFEFRPVQAAYTENHVSLPEMYLEVKRSLWQLGRFEDIVQDGQVRPGVAAIWYSEAGDAWNSHAPPFGAGKRTLAIMARHQQLPLDVVDEEDATRGTLKNYKVLFVTDPNISRAATKAIAQWVREGGRLYCTATAGLRDEFNQPNEPMLELLGLQQARSEIPWQPITYEKQDLPFAPPIDEVTFDGRSFPVFAGRGRLTANTAQVLATFKDGSPALLSRAVGTGTATYAAFLPGLSYFKPAMPLKPVDRGSTNDASAHLVPTRFDPVAAATVACALTGIERPVTCSNPLVEANIIESPHGVAVTLTNWSGAPVKNLQVTLHIQTPAAKIELASQAPIARQTRDGKLTLTLDLDTADAIILR